MPTETKSLLQSKTFWANLIVTVIAVFTALANQEWVKANPGLSAGIVAAVGILNIVLRYVTVLPIAMLLLAVGLGGILSPTETADAGLFRRCDGTWRTPIRTSVAAVASARASRGRLTLFHRGDSACSSGACGSQAAADCPECVTAEKAAAVVAAQRVRLNLGQHSLFKRFEQDHVLRERFAAKWNAKYGLQIDPNRLEDFINIILKYLPSVLEILLTLLR